MRHFLSFINIKYVTILLTTLSILKNKFGIKLIFQTFYQMCCLLITILFTNSIS